MEHLPFESLIKEKFNSLSPGQKKVAEYLIQHMEEAAFSTVVQIGRKVDVSETTVIRFSYALGFSGFTEMQENIQRQILKNSQKPALATGLDTMKATDDERSLFTQSIEADIESMRETLRQLHVVDLWKIVDAIMQADRVLVVGSRASYAAGYWFSLMLSTLRDKVELYPPTGNIYEKMCNLTKKSVVLMISFPRYAKESVAIAKCVKQEGIPLIAVTDQILSPVGRLSDMVLTAVDTDTIISVIAVLEFIIKGINHKYSAQTHLRQQKLEQVYSNYEVFVE